MGASAAPPGWRVFASAAIGVGLLLAGLRVAAPWALTRVYAEPFLYHAWPVLRVVGGVAEPLRAVARFADAVLHRLAGRAMTLPGEDDIGEEIRTIVTEGHREGLLEEDAREMIEGVIELGDADVSQIMTPRTDMHMLQVDLPWDELLADVIHMGHTRIPVFESSRDDVVGVLYVKDLIPELAKSDASRRRTVRDLARKPIFVPETKAVDDLLAMFQQERTHIALVLDEYGGLAGVVTIEDVLEEIVGQIDDLYDEEAEEEIRPTGEAVRTSTRSTSCWEPTCPRMATSTRSAASSSPSSAASPTRGTRWSTTATHGSPCCRCRSDGSSGCGSSGSKPQRPSPRSGPRRVTPASAAPRPADGRARRPRAGCVC